jgi:glycosyltransferase involved in cell wall biosynthesis
MSTKLNITGVDEKPKMGPGEFSLGDNNQMNNEGLWTKSQGGTERMYQRLIKELPKELSDQFQIICSRVRELDANKKKVLWLHDLWNDPENDHLKDDLLVKRFERLVFVSNWQMHSFNMGLGVKYDDSIVLKNAIDPIDEKLINKPDPKKELRLIYHTTPHRGLELLVPVFEYLDKHHKNIHLDVFSSFEIYGWGHRDKQYEHVLDKCKSHPNITYHGFADHSKVMEALGKAHIFAYPSIWVETSCIAVLEAMSAKCITVCPNLGALPETCANFASMYQWTEDPNIHVNRFASILDGTIKAIRNNLDWTKQLTVQKNFFDNFYDWRFRSQEWKVLLEGLSQNKK